MAEGGFAGFDDFDGEQDVALDSEHGLGSAVDGEKMSEGVHSAVDAADSELLAQRQAVRGNRFLVADKNKNYVVRPPVSDSRKTERKLPRGFERSVQDQRDEYREDSKSVESRAERAVQRETREIVREAKGRMRNALDVSDKLDSIAPYDVVEEEALARKKRDQAWVEQARELQHKQSGRATSGGVSIGPLAASSHSASPGRRPSVSFEQK